MAFKWFGVVKLFFVIDMVIENRKEEVKYGINIILGLFFYIFLIEFFYTIKILYFGNNFITYFLFFYYKTQTVKFFYN